MPDDDIPHRDTGPIPPLALTRYDVLTIRDALTQLADRMDEAEADEDPGVNSLAAWFVTLADEFDARAEVMREAAGGQPPEGEANP